MEDYIENFKKKKKEFIGRKMSVPSCKYKNVLSKLLISVIFFLVSIIFSNINDKNLLMYKEYVFTESIPFTKVKKWYEEKFGQILPEQSNIQSVFDEKLVYKEITDYSDGEELTVASNTLVNSLESGVIVYLGNKEDYGSTLIIQGIDGYDIWYGNIENCSYKLYDYVDKGSIIGNTIDDKLYLVIKKDNNSIKYEDYKNK